MRADAKSDDNPIVRHPYVSAGFYRDFVIVGKNYKVPFTVEEIGIKEKLLGIKVTIYNNEQKQEEGVFFTCSEKQWVFSNDEARKKAHKIHIETLPLSNYILTLFLRYVVTKIL